MQTFHSQYRQLQSHGRGRVRTTAGGFRWRATVERYRYDPDQIRKMIEEQTPRNDELHEKARNRRPPQEWFESDDDPTQPED